MTRRTGRTRAMVESIPDEGAFVCVHDGAMRTYVETMIRDVRGIDVARRCRVRVTARRGDEQQLMGLRMAVRFDHYLAEVIDPSLLRRLETIAAGVELVLRPA